MRTLIIKINETEPEEMVIKQAGTIIKQGGLVAFPTETVYGLGADALLEAAASKIYAAKGRPSDNPLIVHIAELSALKKITRNVPKEAVILAEKYWPGPLTMIFQKASCVPYATTGGLETVAVRMPNHKAALKLIQAGGGYIAAPSANLSGRPSPTKAEHVKKDLYKKIEMILDGGSTGIGLESTILDLSGAIPTILRPGAISKEMLEEAVGAVQTTSGLIAEDTADCPKAPGMKYRHYAPKAQLVVVEGTLERMVGKIKELSMQLEEERVGIICTDETMGSYSHGHIKSAGSRKKEETIARNLYGILREFDELEVEVIYTETFETPKMGQAIMNRLRKAAGYRKIIA